MATTPTPQPQQSKPSIFRQILSTGLLGLAGGLAAKNDAEAFGAGLDRVGQAYDETMKRSLAAQANDRANQQLQNLNQQTANDTVRANAQAKLDDAQAAVALTNKLHMEKLMSQMDVEAQQKASKTFADVTATFLQAGLPVRAEIDDTPEARTQFLQQLKDQGQNPTQFIFAPDPNKGKIFVLQRDNSRVLDKELASQLSKAVGFDIPAGTPVAIADSYISHKLAGEYQLKVARENNARALEVAKLMQGGAPNNPVVQEQAGIWANLVSSGQATLPQVPNFPKGLRNAVAAQIAGSGRLVVNPELRQKLEQMSSAEAAVEQFEQTLNEYLKTKTPANALRLNAQRAAFSRIVGRATGEKGVFTDPDKADFARILGPGLVFSTADPDLAHKQIEDIKDYLSNIKMRQLQTAFKTFRASDLQNPQQQPQTQQPQSSAIEEYNPDGTPVK